MSEPRKRKHDSFFDYLLEVRIVKKDHGNLKKMSDEELFNALIEYDILSLDQAEYLLESWRLENGNNS